MNCRWISVQKLDIIFQKENSNTIKNAKQMNCI